MKIGIASSKRIGPRAMRSARVSPSTNEVETDVIGDPAG
jgi:hypothetical protein